MTQLMEDDAIEGWFASAPVVQDEEDGDFAQALACARADPAVRGLEDELLCHRLERDQEEQRAVALALRLEAEEREADEARCAAAACERRQAFRRQVCAAAVSRRSVPSLVLHGVAQGGGAIDVPALWALAATYIAHAGFRGRTAMKELGIPYDPASMVERAADALEMLPIERVDERAGLPSVVLGAEPPPLREESLVPVGMKRPRSTEEEFGRVQA